MAKQTGLGDNLYVADYDLSGDVGSLSRIGGSVAPLEVTAINSSGIERIGGLRDGSIEFTSYFNPSAGQEHEKLSALPTTNAIVSYYRGTAVGNASASLVAKQINYDGTRGDDGAFTLQCECLGNAYGLEWGIQLTAGISSISAAATGTSWDGAAQTTDGAQAYLHVTEFTGTDATITVEDSADDSTWGTLATFTQVTAAGAERIAVTGTVERYIRVRVSGTFTTMSYAVSVVKNTTTVVF